MTKQDIVFEVIIYNHEHVKKVKIEFYMLLVHRVLFWKSMRWPSNTATIRELTSRLSQMT